MKLPFRIVNVFTTGGDRLSGNPLCVFEDARGLTTEQMQALARQLNLSETTFVLPPERGGSARVRIFTPGFEMPFAGHPTLGTSFVVARGTSIHPHRPSAVLLAGSESRLASVVLELNAGDIEVVEHAGSWTLRALAAPKTRAVDASRAELAAMIGLPESAIAGDPLWVSTGVEQLVIPITSADHVRAARPVPELVHRHGYSQSRDEAMAYVWAPDGTVRFFFTQHGAVIEDPATGSAAANLGGYFVATKRALPVEMTLRQGDAVARPSTLRLRVDAHGAIFVGGDVIELGSGTFDL